MFFFHKLFNDILAISNDNIDDNIAILETVID